MHNGTQRRCRLLKHIKPSCVQRKFQFIEAVVVFKHLRKNVIIRLQAALSNENVLPGAQSGPCCTDSRFDILVTGQQSAVLERVGPPFPVMVENLQQRLSTLISNGRPRIHRLGNESPIRMSRAQELEQGLIED